jgi:hypothetical protein
MFDYPKKSDLANFLGPNSFGNSRRSAVFVTIRATEALSLTVIFASRPLLLPYALSHPEKENSKL